MADKDKELKALLEKLNKVEAKIDSLEKENAEGTFGKLLKVSAIMTSKMQEKANTSLDKLIERLEKGTPEEKKPETSSILIKNGDINVFRGGKEPIVIRNKACVDKILGYIEDVIRGK